MKENVIFNSGMTIGEIQIRIKRGQEILCPICGGTIELWSEPNLNLPGFPMGIFCSTNPSHAPVILGYPSITGKPTSKKE